MATTQYIGARYVPLFFTNPDDNSNNWKSGVVYDPLTIVTDLNQSYTSKIPVPASVGRPSENPNYWILTGNYNAQVDAYRQDVENLSSDVQNLSGKIDGVEDDLSGRIDRVEKDLSGRLDEIEEDLLLNGIAVWIGDSYTQANSLGADQDKRFATLVSANLGLTERNFAIGGSGFLGPSGDTYLDQITNANNTLTDDEKNNVKYVFVCGGRNDPYTTPNYTLSQLNNAIASVYTYIHTHFQNAIIVGVPMMWAAEQLSFVYQTYLQNVLNCMQLQTSGKNIIIENAHTWLLGRWGLVLNDNVHPTVGGHAVITGFMTDSILNGYSRRYPIITKFTTNGMTTIIRMVNDVVEVSIQGTPTNALAFGGWIENNRDLGENFGIVTGSSYPITLVGRDGSTARCGIGFYTSNRHIQLAIQLFTNGMTSQEYFGSTTFNNGFRTD